MKRLLLSLASLLILTTGAMAAPTWMVFNVTVSAANAPKVIAATDKLMNSAVGKEFPGRLLLQGAIANGPSPTTHSFAALYHSAAEAEAFTAKLQADPAWTEFTSAMADLSQPVSEIRLVSMKSWGSLDDSDVVTMVYSLSATDSGAIREAIDTYMATPTGQAYPGQVHLVAVQAGGLIPVTHSVVAGFASVAEMEQWQDGLADNEDYQNMIDEIQEHSEFRGSTMARTLKTWGTAATAEVVTN